MTLFNLKEGFGKVLAYSQTEKGLKTFKNVAIGLQVFGVVATGAGSILNGYTNRMDQKRMLETEQAKMEETFVTTASSWLNSSTSMIVDAKIHRAVRDEIATLDPDELRNIWEEASKNV